MDFTSHNDEAASRLSSPLTELSSLDDEDDATSSQFSPIVNGAFDEHSAAKVNSFTLRFPVTFTKLHKVLCGLSSKRRGNFTNALALHGLSKVLVDKSVQTESDMHVNSSAVVKNKVGRPRKVRQLFNSLEMVYNCSQHPLAPELSISVPGKTLSKTTNEPATTSSNATVSTLRRKRVSQNVIPEPSSRQLRSSSRHANTESSMTSISSLVRSIAHFEYTILLHYFPQSSVPQVEELSNRGSAPLNTTSVQSVTHAQPKSINVKVWYLFIFFRFDNCTDLTEVGRSRNNFEQLCSQ